MVDSAAARRRASVALGAAVAAGLASRRLDVLPEWLGSQVGDALWATTVVLGLGILRPQWGPLDAALAGFAFAVLVEVSQLWHPAWLDELRGNGLVALVLGRGFLWVDLVRYAVGCGLGAILLRWCGGVGSDGARALRKIDS